MSVKKTVLKRVTRPPSRQRSKARILRDYLREEMVTHRIPIGGRLPTEVELAEQFSVSRSTARQVLIELSIQGLVDRQQGRGTFRAESKELQQRSMMVGVWLNWPSGSLYAPISEGIREELIEWDYHGVFEDGGLKAGDEAQGITSLVRKNLDGFIITPAWFPRDRSSPLIELLDRNLPLVLVHMKVPDHEADLVCTNGELAAEKVVQHLVELGHQRIAFIGHGALSPTEERLRGYVRSMRRYGLAVDDAWVQTDEAVIHDWGRRASRELLDLPLNRRPTAIFGVDWYVETLAMEARERGLSIPQDLSVVGLDDLTNDDPPWLTTYAPSKRRIGREAARLLMKRIERPEMELITVMLDGELIIRNSTAAPPDSLVVNMTTELAASGEVGLQNK